MCLDLKNKKTCNTQQYISTAIELIISEQSLFTDTWAEMESVFMAYWKTFYSLDVALQ